MLLPFVRAWGRLPIRLKRAFSKRLTIPVGTWDPLRSTRYSAWIRPQRRRQPWTICGLSVGTHLLMVSVSFNGSIAFFYTAERALLTLGIEHGSELGELPTIDARPVVADGWHNAFAALTAWNGRYWLAYRRGSGHTARDGVIVVSVSSDLTAWEEVILFETRGR